MTGIVKGLVAVLLLVAPTGIAAQAEAPEPASPTVIADEFLQAYRSMAWGAAADRMHPDALADFRLRVMLLTENERNREALVRLVDGRGVAELEAMRPQRLFEVVMTALGREAPGLIHALASREMEVVGAVPEGPERTHVVYRVIPSLSGDPARMQVMTLHRVDDRWGVLEADELDVLGTALGAIPRTTGTDSVMGTRERVGHPLRSSPGGLDQADPRSD